MSTEPHIADAEAGYFTLAVTPDICRVGKDIIAFKSMQILSSEDSAYSQTVFARDEKVLLLKSVLSGVKGNAGKGLMSGVAVKCGHVEIKEGSNTVIIEDRLVARDGDEVDMNVAV
jgi:hypothetical protein